MKKKIYQPPRMKVRSVRAQQIICGSIKTERLTEDDFDWGNYGSTTERLTEDDFVW